MHDGWERPVEPLSPREIQARVRAGESPEVIAAETGWPLDRVERYAEPPLAERAFIAGQAQQAEVRRSGEPVLLADTVAIAMTRAGREADEVDWDAWRREDGRWIVTASAPGATATWTYDVAGRTVHPLDDSARRLMGVEEATPPARPAAERPHLVAVPEPPEAEEARSGADEVEIPRVVEERTQATGAARPPLDALFQPEAHDTVVLPREEAAPEAKPATAPRKGKGRRASVPSWDEILFGTPRED